MSCKKMVDIENPTLITMKNGRTRVTGDCSVVKCQARISKIVA